MSSTRRTIRRTIISSSSEETLWIGYQNQVGAAGCIICSASMLTIEEAASLLRLPVSSIQEWVSNAEVHFVQTPLAFSVCAQSLAMKNDNSLESFTPGKPKKRGSISLAQKHAM